MATTEEVNTILTFAGQAVSSPQPTVQEEISLPIIDAQSITSSVDMGKFKPIVMTISNLAAATEMAGMGTSTGSEVGLQVMNVPAATNTVTISDMVERTNSIQRQSKSTSTAGLTSVYRRNSGGQLIKTSTVKKEADSNTYKTPKTSEVYFDSDSGVTYEIVRGGTKRGGDKLIDSLGFTYNLKSGREDERNFPALPYVQRRLVCGQGRVSKNLTYWWCAVRNSHLRCPACVIQKNGVFTRGKRKHEHVVGQCRPKPHLLKPKKEIQDKSPRPSVPNRGVGVARSRDGDYMILQEASKSGMDLLKDRLGYTYTLKKAYADGQKKQWRCSVRNKFVTCHAVVSQLGDKFETGSSWHAHMPRCSKPVTEFERVPTLSDNVYMEEEEDDDGGHKSGFSSYEHKNVGTKHAMHKQKVMMMKEKKRKEHPTFLGPSCTINLTKCYDPQCDCKQVHCPFCDTQHFKPAKAGRVQDHLEMTHFAHGVQYDDLMIVKCFQDCSNDRSFGHYHCVFCFKQILKRSAYARHMLRHLRNMGIPDRLLVLPDSKYPDVINAYGYEIPVCKKETCDQSREKHYHCPQCATVCKERSLTVNHLWRCLQRNDDNREEDQLSDDAEDEMMNVVDESQLNLHLSHMKLFKDLSVEKCEREDCCNQKYHCQLCPNYLFHPTYKQHLIAHYVTHWNQRIPYKGYSILKCFHMCEGIDRSQFKTKYHFHCPICAKIIFTKASFEDHLKTCHMFRFGENLFQLQADGLDTTMDEEMSAVRGGGDVGANEVEIIEEYLTTKACEEEKKKKNTRQKLKLEKEPHTNTRTKSWQHTSKDLGSYVKSTIKTIKQEMDFDDDMDAVSSAKKRQTGKRSKNDPDIPESEVLEIGSVVISDKIIKVLKSTAKTVLRRITSQTKTKLIYLKNKSRYVLSGQLDDLLAAKMALAEAVRGKGGNSNVITKNEKEGSYDESNKEDQSCSQQLKPVGKGGGGKQKKESCDAVTSSSSSKKNAPETGKRKRGRPKNKTTGDRFPYSEIKEIIAATKESDGPKRGRGRPVKNTSTPDCSSNTEKKAKVNKVAKTKSQPPPTPGRYGTRGIKRNYLEMSVGKIDIKTEPLSENENDINTDDEVDESLNKTDKIESDEDDFEYVFSDNEGEKEVTNKYKDGTNDSYLDDSEQDIDDETSSEFDDEDENNDEKGEELNNTATIGSNIIIMSPEKINSKITDSAVKQLRTSNVSTSVPQVFKVGMRQMKIPLKKTHNGEEKMAGEKEQNDATKLANLKCSLCDNHTAEDFSDLSSHLKSYHHVYDLPRCDICERDFDTMHTLNHHLQIRHGPKPEPAALKCSYEGCEKSFTSQNGLTGHINRVHIGQLSLQKKKRYSCGSCDFECNSMEGLCEHRKLEHNIPIQCDTCKKEFQNYWSLKAHNDTAHSSSGFVNCEICNKQFRHKSYLLKHMQLHYSSGFECHICHKKVTSKYSLRDHLETHKPATERSYKHVCSYCGKQFALKSNYVDHLNKHTGEKPYKCDLCMRSFGFRSMLLKHKTFVHSTERPFKCGYCMKGFKFMNLLQNHITTHVNTSKHVCSTCSKVFSTASTLKFHRQKCKGKQNLFVTAQTTAPNTLILYTDTPAVSGINYTNQVRDVDMPEQQVLGVPTKMLPDSDNVNTQQVVEYSEIGSITSDGAENEMHVQNSNLGMTAVDGVQNEMELPSAAMTAENTATEVYACSECNSTFASYVEAEAHVLSGHPPTMTIVTGTNTVEVTGDEMTSLSGICPENI